MCRATDGGIKALVTAELLPRLRRLCPQLTERDLLFFGTRCDVAAPVGAKYGIDTDAESVYNVVNGTDCLLSFSEAAVKGGFIGLTVSDETLEFLLREALRRFGSDTAAAGTVETGDETGCVRALLATAAGRSGAADGIPSDRTLRRALWLCITADSPASFARAVSAASEAVSLHRRGVALGKAEMQLGPSAARAMAASLGRFINKDQGE